MPKIKKNYPKYQSSVRQAGFSHLLIPIAIVVIVIVGTGSIVVAGNHHKATTQSVNLTDTKAPAATPTSNSSATKVTTASPAQAVGSVPAQTTPAKAAPVVASTPAAQKVATTPAATPAAATVTAVTPLSVLTTIISNLDAGSPNPALVTSHNIALAGPIGTASGRPIVFSANGQTYFAYSQEQAPNFNQSASQTAGSMAVTSATGAYTTEYAHLDKSNNLVDENEAAVGYSSGGD